MEEFLDRKVKDYSGTSSLLPEKAPLMDGALSIVKSYEERYGEEKIGKLWEAINAATKATLEKNRTSGIISRGVEKEVGGMFDFYIPLRGFDEEVASDVYDYVDNYKGGSSLPTVKKAEGRTSLSDDPFAMIMFAGQNAIIQVAYSSGTIKLGPIGIKAFLKVLRL